jgi:hypothetical protein
MIRLTDIGRSWRNYLFANQDASYNDVKDFMTSVELITDSREQLVNSMLTDVPDMILVEECRQEIAYQRMQLKDMMCEFVEQINNDIEVESTPEALANDFIDEISENGTQAYFFKIAKEWEEYSEKTENIWNCLSKSSDIKIYSTSSFHDDICKIYFDEMYGHN